MFCKSHGLSTQGAKLDLVERIRVYLSTGSRRCYKPISKQVERDSLKFIAKNTLVQNYNNDVGTRKFFVEHLGEIFTFNSYLRQFTNPDNIQPNMTYGDLINGWILSERNRKYHAIAPQFKYNQFIRDYFIDEKVATLAMAVLAWKSLISKRGPRTYKQFKKNEK